MTASDISKRFLRESRSQNSKPCVQQSSYEPAKLCNATSKKGEKAMLRKTMRSLWLKLYTSEKGVTTVEYAIMLALVAIIVATTSPSISTAVTDTFGDAINAMGQGG